MAARSEASDTTTLWPIAATGSLPTCLRLMVNSLHDEGTVIESTLNWIASLPSMVVLQFSTTASFPPPAAAAAGLAAASAPVAGAVPATGSGVAAGVVVGAGSAAGAVVAAGVCVSGAGGGESAHADSASAQLMQRLVSFRFIAFSRDDDRNIIAGLAIASSEEGWATTVARRHGSRISFTSQSRAIRSIPGTRAWPWRGIRGGAAIVTIVVYPVPRGPLPGSSRMKPTNLISPLRWLGMLVLLLMAVAVFYAGYTAIVYWPSIAV